jgi:hypothetical protein
VRSEATCGGLLTRGRLTATDWRSRATASSSLTVIAQPTSVANHLHSEVQGAAQATAAVTVNGASAERQGGFFLR